MKIFYENIDGISDHKIRDLAESSSTADYEIIALTETWLNQSVKKEILDDRYTVYRKDRETTAISQTATRGGGVLIAVRSTIKCELYSNDKMEDLEALCVRIPTSSGLIYVYCLYIQPTASVDIYCNHLDAIESMMSEINNSDTLLLLGDFNFGNVVTWQENDSGFDYLPFLGNSNSIKANKVREATNRMIDCGLFQISNVKNKSGNVLETVYTNMPELTTTSLADFPLLPSYKSDDFHVPLMCTIECAPTLLPNTTRDPVFCFRKANFDLIREHLNGIDFSVIVSESSDLNDMVTSLYDIIYETFEKFIPKSSLRSSTKPKWHDRQLSQLKNKRNSCYKKLCNERKCHQSQPFTHEQLFLQARDDYESYRKQIFSDYLREQASSLKSNPKAFWKHVNSKRIDNSIPSEIKLNDQKATTDVDKANMFAKFFQSVYVNRDRDNELSAFIENRSENNCFNMTFTYDSVYSVLSTMDISKGSGYDGVSSIFLRECAEILAEPLSVIYSRSIRDGTYPDRFKIGQITPIFKSGHKNDVENYRGVSVLPNMAKVFEKLMYRQLKLIIPPRISTNQHGFLTNRNIETNLMEMSIHIHNAFEQNAQLDVFYADISKAFDCVDPDLLIRKLANYPLSNETLRFFVSYLSNRKQYVKCNDAKSDLFNVASGVGQGTILGPLFFLVMFDDSDDHDNGEELISLNFADDKKKAKLIKSISDAVQLQQSIDKFSIWCVENGLKINLSKCQVITFTNKKSPIVFDYKINGHSIKRVTGIRDLGVILDKKLNFNTHLEYTINKTKTALQFVKRQSYFFDTDVTKILYFALVRSNIEFACAIWSPFHETHRTKLESIQRQMVIYLNGDHLKRDENNYVLEPYTQRCKKFDLVSLIRRRVNASALFIHAIIIGKINSPLLRSSMVLNEGVRSLRKPEFIRLKASRTDTSTHSSFNNACYIFNHAALFLDPTLPHHEFRKKLIELPDSAFGPWTKI